jgi:hypothetical protein
MDERALSISEVSDPQDNAGRLRALGAARKIARAAQAYLAGVGTSGSLLAGAALMFILASALVGFRGWPHVGAQPSPGEVVISPSPASSTASPVARRLELISAAAVAGAPAPARPATGAARLGRRGTTTARGPATRRSIGQPASTSLPVGAPTVAGGSEPAAPSCVAGCGSPTVPAPAPSTQPAQRAVQQASSGLGNVVSSAGNKLGSAAQRTTGTVAGAIQPTSPPAAGAVGGAGSGAAKTVTGVTRTVAGALSGIGPR